jgi:DNA topoisomerase-1
VLHSIKTSSAVRLTPPKSARKASLVYASDEEPGIRRKEVKDGFVYISSKGRELRNRETLGRIRALAIPPAWNDVWISPDPDGHLQATGRDQRGRKQYRYHPRWSACRDEVKYSSLLAFARALPALRLRIDRDLRRRSLSRDRVIASIVWLLDNTMIRVGNAAYARDNKSFGLTTLRDRHVEIKGFHIALRLHRKIRQELAPEADRPAHRQGRTWRAGPAGPAPFSISRQRRRPACLELA